MNTKDIIAKYTCFDCNDLLLDEFVLYDNRCYDKTCFNKYKFTISKIDDSKMQLLNFRDIIIELIKTTNIFDDNIKNMTYKKIIGNNIEDILIFCLKLPDSFVKEKIFDNTCKIIDTF